jgi:hypothetical protein
MAIIWLISPFPQKILQSSYSETIDDGHIRTQMDAGPAKVRKRSDANTDRFQGRLVLTSTQTQDLDDFYKTTLGNGALSFEWLHQRTGTTGTFRFVKAPSYRSYGQNYTADLEWEQLPE